MSPVSRGRKPKKPHDKRPPGSARQARARQEIPDIAQLYVGDIEEPESVEQLQEILDRRMFAMPFFGTRIGTRDYPTLDPGDPDERKLLIAGEHPEYHHPPEQMDEGPAALHIMAHEIVASQLWDNDPPEAWVAAQRLTADGLDRHEVLHALGAVALESIYKTLSEDDPSPEEAREALRSRYQELTEQGMELLEGQEAELDGVQLQLKVSLRGMKPPVWRRITVPGSLYLDELHEIIQVLFGWSDSHLHQFEGEGDCFAPHEFELDDTVCTEHVMVGELLAEPGEKISYTYDFGDNWRHEILLEAVSDADPDQPAVSCLAGKQPAPLEDWAGDEDVRTAIPFDRDTMNRELTALLASFAE